MTGSPEKPPGKRNTRLNSKAQAEQDKTVKSLKVQRTYYINQTKRIEDQVKNEEIFLIWSTGDINERIKKLENISSNLERIQLDLMCIAEIDAEDDHSDEPIMTLKAKLSNRRDTLCKDQGVRLTKENLGKLSINVQQTDGLGNIPNTWGKFDGDPKKWKSFRDRWIAAIHESDDIKAVVKMRSLKEACVGKAENAIALYDYTEEDYQKAWLKLNTSYEDDYMQVQAYMQLLHKLPSMSNASSTVIRNTIDTVQKHIHGLKGYFKLTDLHPYAVFTVIDRMDKETYRAWEKHRPSLIKANAQDAEQNGEAENNANKISKHIPTWAELEAFLEGEVTIRMHDERHSLTKDEHHKQSPSKKKKRFNKHNNAKNKEEYPEFLQCTLCENIHPLYNCSTFEEMNLNGRKNHVAHHALCVRCLRKNHDGPCVRKKCNDPCPKCKPDTKYHNSLLCPNRTERSGSTLATFDKRGKKRRNQNGQNKPTKKRRFANDRSSQSNASDLKSGVNKIGDWSIVAKQSNAIKGEKFRTTGKAKYTVLLATINMRIQTNSNNAIICRAIADTGAMINCITKRFVESSELSTVKCQKTVLGVTGPEIIKRKVKATIKPWFESNIEIKTDFFILNQLEGIYPHCQIEASKELIMQLGLADENFDIPSPINALLSAEFYTNIIGENLFRHKDGAIMQSTSFGHIILGKFAVKEQFSSDLPTLNIILNKETENDSLENAIRQFWEIEEINKSEGKNSLSEEQNEVEKIFIETHFREKSGRYVVKIPIKPECKGLGESRNIALKQFLQLERRLERNSELKQKYAEYMNEYIKLGYMRLANSKPDPHFTYYLPHHPVQKKFRVVVNASQKTHSGESLNSIQMIGSKLQCDTQLQIMRFRRFEVGVATDISKMFNRIGLHQSQWDLQRILWRESPKEQLKEYVITVVMFGLASSAYNAVRTLIQCAKDQEKKFPNAAETIQKCFYMDDGIFGCENAKEAKILCKEIEFVLSQGGFELKGWASNSKEVETYMNAENANVKIIGDDDEAKILGLCWLKPSDEMTIFVKQAKSCDKMSKRNILSEIARLHDPNGFIAPILIKAKMLMQDIWRLKNVEWDDEVPDLIKSKWQEFRSDLNHLSEFRIKRWLKTSHNCETQIHAFCDASEAAYGIAIYVRVVNKNGNIFSSLLSSKSRVAPLNKVSIPRLELLAALMLSEQLETIVETCEFQNNQITLWTDSIVVLHWLKKNPLGLKAFVANRVKIIKEKTKRYNWKHVKSSDNPADLVSRGMKMRDFIKSEFWLHGPNWLREQKANWPIPKLEISPETRNEIEKECKANSNQAKAFNICSGKDDTILYNKFQEWSKIVNVTAYVLRLCRKARKEDGIPYSRFVTAEERKNATEFWIKFEQKKAFKKEIECIKSRDKFPSKSDIASLRPILDKNEILRVGGRIDKANITYDKRHQFIVPQKSRLSYLLLKHAHTATLHGGAQVMIQFLRKNFWIPRIRAEAKQYINTCVECVRQAQATSKQIMSELPEIRIKPAPPFKNVGVDMAGPYNMRITDKVNMNTRARTLPEIKGWVAVFICLVTRAVHLEPTEGMSTKDFLEAYQRFANRRGTPEKIYSDNGTNFVGANNELQKAFKIWKAEEIQYAVSLSDTKWHFITPSAPHEGGIWEAAVKSMKHHLKRIMGTQKYSIKGITTLLTSVEAVLNSRPLCTLSDDPDDLEALTPGHFLIGRPLKSPLHEKTDSPPYNANRLFLQLQFQIQAFWKKWSIDYLQALTQIPKWREEKTNLKVGQLVIIKCDNVPPTYWAMGRIVKTHEGIDGKVRSVTLKTQTGELERSIRKLCVLPSDIELSYWC